MRAPRTPIDIQAYLARFEPPATPEDALAKLPRLASRLKNRDFAESAAMIAGLATERAFHAHQVRLDWAIRILSASATGSRLMDRVALDRLLNEDFPKLRLHAQEDPLEQPFVGRLVTRHGAFHLLAGVFDQSAAFTDLIVSAFEVLPGSETAGPMARALALLRLGDALLERAEQDVWSLGPDTPVAKVKLPSPADLTLLSARARFSEMALAQLGIDARLLEPFRLTEADLPLVAASPVGASPLDCRPLWRSGEDWIVLAPGSISVAVRSCLIDAVVELKLQRAMAQRMLSIQHDRLTECGFLKDGPEAMVNHGGQPRCTVRTMLGALQGAANGLDHAELEVDFRQPFDVGAPLSIAYGEQRRQEGSVDHFAGRRIFDDLVIPLVIVRLIRCGPGQLQPEHVLDSRNAGNQRTDDLSLGLGQGPEHGLFGGPVH